MDFGMIPYDGLTEQMFILPDVQQPFLPGIKNKNPLFYLGLPRWNYREEEKKKNSPHPQPGTLPFYSNYFNALELNETYFEIPATEKIIKWRESVGMKNFKFCPQFYKAITHAGKIDMYKMGITKQFLNRLMDFKEKLGTSFIELQENYRVEDHEELIEYLKQLPEEFELSVEIRNPAFLADTEKFTAFIKGLNKIDKGMVITDSPGRRDAVHMQLSNATAFIRFNCRGDDVLDMFRIEEWKKQLRSWYLQGLEKCYFFLHICNRQAEQEFVNYVQQELKFTA